MATSTPVSQREFVRVLRVIPKPAPSVLKLLRAHAKSKNKTSIARELARAAGYKDFRGFNLQHGILAKRIGAALGRKGARLELLVHFDQPGELKNKEWLIFMRPELCRALKTVGWI